MIEVTETMATTTDDDTTTENKVKTKTKKKAAKKVDRKAKKAKKAKAKIHAKYARGHKGTKKATGTQGQNGPELELKPEKMNDDERAMFDGAFTAKGDRKEHSIKELQSFIDGKPVDKIKNTSPARNGLRRLVRAGWFEKGKRGKYKITEKSRKRSIKGV